MTERRHSVWGTPGQRKAGGIGCLAAILIVLLIITIGMLTEGHDKTAGVQPDTPVVHAVGSIASISSGNNSVNVQGLVEPADAEQFVVPAITQILAQIRDQVQSGKIILASDDQTLTLEIKLRERDGGERDFGNLMFPLRHFATAARGSEYNLLDRVSKVERGTGPGIEAASAWCRIPGQRARAPSFCAKVDAA